MRDIDEMDIFFYFDMLASHKGQEEQENTAKYDAMGL